MNNFINTFVNNLPTKDRGMMTFMSWVQVSKTVDHVVKKIPLNKIEQEANYLVGRISLLIASLVIGAICSVIISKMFFSQKKPPSPPPDLNTSPTTPNYTPRPRTVGVFNFTPEPKIRVYGREANKLLNPNEYRLRIHSKEKKEVSHLTEITAQNSYLRTLRSDLPSLKKLELIDLTIDLLPKELHVDTLILQKSCINKYEKKLVVNNLRLKYVENCDSIFSHIDIKDELIISDTSIKQLPKKTIGFVNDSNRFVTAKGLSLKHLELSNLSDLEALPDALDVETLIIENCPIRQLPQQLNVKKLVLIKCPIQEIPPNLSLNELDIRDCPLLRTIPPSTVVKTDLSIKNCESFTGLPGNYMHIGGNINFDGCKNLSFIPSWITTLGPLANGSQRSVNLTGTNLLQEVIEDLKNHDAYGIQFFFSLQAAKVEKEFRTLQEALDFWGKLAGQSVDASLLNLEENESKDVNSFLERMVNTDEYAKKIIRPYLARRLIDVFQVISEDHEIRERALKIMFEAISTCDDRVIQGLDSLEIMIDIDRLERADISEAKFREEGQRYLLLEMVNKAATEHAKTLTWVDEVEVYLAFQIGLAERFNLPIKTRGMIFKNMAQITPEQLQAFGDEIERECTSEKLGKFLETWSPWIKSERSREAGPYDELPFDEKFIPEQDDRCAITQAEYPEIEQPIVYQDQLYDYDSFRKWFISGGKNPFNTMEAIDWALVKQIPKYQSEETYELSSHAQPH